MNRYIRTKDGKIFEGAVIETELYNSSFYNDRIGEQTFYSQKMNRWGFVNDIIAESDNILDLIQVGDLIEDDYIDSILFVKSSTINFFKDEIENYNSKIPEDLGITKIYTKQGNNYILVWNKEQGVI